MISKKAQFITNHTFHIALLLLIGTIIGSIGVGFFIQNNPFIKEFDSYFYELISTMPRNSVLDTFIAPVNYNFIHWLTFIPGVGGMPTFLFFYVGGFLLSMFIFKRSLFWWGVMSVVGATLLAMIVTAFDWYFVFRQRPFTELPNHLSEYAKQAWIHYSSFPSGHSRETALYSTLIGSYFPKVKWIVGAFTLFVAFSRIYLGAHYPTDVISGVLIGFITAKITLIVAREIQIISKDLRGGDPHAQRPQSRG